MICFLYTGVDLPILEFHINGIIQYPVFASFLLLSMFLEQINGSSFTNDIDKVCLIFCFD